MTPEERHFYSERDRRTIAYGTPAEALERSIGIRIGPRAAETTTGQILLLTAVNIAARVHRHMVVDVPDVPLQAPALVPSSSLLDAAIRLATAVDPYIRIKTSAVGFEGPVLAVGDGRGTIHTGAHGYQATVAGAPQAVVDHPAGVLGAGLAACLGTAALLQVVVGSRPVFRTTSLWLFDDCRRDQIGPLEPIAPLDVGANVAVIGAGAVGSAVAYWAYHLGVQGRWSFVDGDVVELHNTNRSIGMFAADAGWPNGRPQGPGYSKAEIAAALISGDPEKAWYDEWVVNTPRPDLIIPVANDRGIRQNIGHLGLPLLIHAATSPNWTAELHRHGPRDDCPSCRFPAIRSASFECAQGPLEPRRASESTDTADAALPFLSAAAGLLIIAALTQLGMGYLDLKPNHHRLLFESGVQMSWLSSIKSCSPSCRIGLSSKARTLNAGHRWSHLEE